jgi:hypothetical protein
MEYNLTLRVTIQAKNKERAEEIRGELPSCLQIARVDGCIVKCAAGPVRKVRRAKQKR